MGILGMESNDFEYFSSSESDTIALGKKLAHISKRGDTFALFGTLGMGKSVLARAFIQELSGATDVPSPTFTLLQSYEGPDFEIYHFDLYRLKSPEEIFEIGMEDALYDAAYQCFKGLCERGITLYLSTIAISEYCVQNEMDSLPLRNLRIIPFNVDHAVMAGKMNAEKMRQRDTGNIPDDRRAVVINDIKMMAQASIERIDYFITCDTKAKKTYEIILNASKHKFLLNDIFLPSAQ